MDFRPQSVSALLKQHVPFLNSIQNEELGSQAPHLGVNAGRMLLTTVAIDTLATCIIPRAEIFRCVRTVIRRTDDSQGPRSRPRYLEFPSVNIQFRVVAEAVQLVIFPANYLLIPSSGSHR
ncbi:hypothetical protein EVAR_33015_1 [Eumeta japonica]|uniref:Uncharacterized protein n=1 Tax=Eumeta variegata TaxID=151549 RepID=A0A4C1VQ78_EUMVA|nr:hypothetical protein EVAR_33015_1 [Eumeta japonica]